MGRRNQLALVDAFAEAAPPASGVPLEFEVRASLLVELLAHADTSDLRPKAQALAELIAALVTQHPERAPVERSVYVRTATIDAHAGEWTRALFIDPTPFAGPDERLWMVAWTDAWTR